MAKKEITVHAPATPIDLNGVSDSPDTIADDFVPSDAVWLSVRQAAEYCGKKKAQITKAISGGKLHARTREVHPDFPPLTEISKVDLDAWNAPKAPKADHAGARATRGGQARRWLLYVPDSQIDAVKAALAPFGIAPTTAYRNKKQKAESTEPHAETQTANAEQRHYGLMTDAQRESLLNTHERGELAPKNSRDDSTPVEQDAPAPASISDELELVEA